MTTIGITGATGTLGGRVTSLLAGADMRLDLRLLVRDAARAPDVDTDVRECTYADRDAVLAALRGVETLFMVSTHEGPQRRDEHRTFVAAAAEAGVRHVVYTSFVGAAPDTTFTLGHDHHFTEQAIRDSGMSYTFLRDNFYLDVLPLFADDHGVLRGPGGRGRLAAVARADVADAAAVVLRDPADHAGAAYDMTGPEALRLDEVAARAGAVLGREMSYVEEGVDEAYASRRAGWPDARQWQLDAWVSTYTAIADGSLARVSPDVERLLGRPARTLEQALEQRPRGTGA
ncbi:Quinone oxidoreductase 2 [Nocardioides dokdonensis FR1436]|uniref:Quinone oxidoreductase 2 n=1 Tax=Nocardioides dokdonensis FR1436 TaxID=1300347 RepID=A0A1A9GG44_9ACTN|nr:NAD(P)H-binding protein [Nocardioides dokdonensis]ANH37238.1 Quinone oxidoreductase 2 [Nocardioides dokdonensis FR1436]